MTGMFPIYQRIADDTGPCHCEICKFGFKGSLGIWCQDEFCPIPEDLKGSWDIPLSEITKLTGCVKGRYHE